jgi:4-hydroxy-3-methylbut-2-enyl diphosphate reductase
VVGAKEVLLAEPRGFCAGVDRAIEIVERALAKFGAPIYVRHEIVHNTFVVNDLKAKGAIFIEELDEVPPGATLIFSAHGVSKAVQQRPSARLCHLRCDLPAGHQGACGSRQAGQGRLRVPHDRPQGPSRGRRHHGPALRRHSPGRGRGDVAKVAPRQTEKLAVVTQTTLSVDDAAGIKAAIKARFPLVREPKQQDICYATQNRQDAVKVLAPQVDLVIVVGSPTSSNSNRLRELADRLGTPAYMVDNALELKQEWFADAARVGLTAGASAPEVLVDEVIARIRQLGASPCARWTVSRKPSSSRCPRV